MITIEEIQKRLVEELKYCKMSKIKIAKAVGLSKHTVANYMNCQRMPSLDTFANLCKELDLDAEYILFLK